MFILLGILQFIFSNFWIWLGFLILISISLIILSEPITKIISSVGCLMDHKAECYRLVRELILKNDEWNTVQKIAFFYQIRTRKGFDKFVQYIRQEDN